MAKRFKYLELSSEQKQEIIDYYKEHTSLSTYTRFRLSEGVLEKILLEYNIPKHTQAESMRLGVFEKYGVYNIAQSEVYKETIRTRPREKVKASSEQRKKTNKERYGVEHVLQDKTINERAQQTCLERHGSKNFATSDHFVEVLHDRNMKKYGVTHPMKLQLFKDQYVDTCLKTYGVTNYSLSEEFKSKQMQFTLDKFDNEQFKSLFYDKQGSIDFLDGKNYSVGDLSSYFDVSVPTIEAWLVRHDLKDYIVHKQSRFENELKLLYPMFKLHERVALGNGQELDLYCEKLKLGIEFNGSYWHSQLAGTPVNYHINKSKLAQDQGIRIIHIYEYEWNDPRRQAIIRSIIDTAIGQNITRYYARQCSLKSLSNKDLKEFLDNNHIQGHKNAKHAYGLFYNDELIQVMSFDNNRYNRNLKSETEWEISRSCSKLNTVVIGGLSKLLTAFIRDVNPTRIFTYCDFNKFDGKGYEQLGMSFEGYTGPDKTWIIGDKDVGRNPSKNKELKEIASTTIYGAGSKKYSLYLYGRD